MDPVDEGLIDPSDPVLIEWEIMKFKPGLSQNYIPRWIQITKWAFRYYRNYYHSASSFSRPLVAIPFQSIKEIKWVKIPASQVTNNFINEFEKSLNEF